MHVGGSRVTITTSDRHTARLPVGEWANLSMPNRVGRLAQADTARFVGDLVTVRESCWERGAPPGQVSVR
jgi:hypothetical protein